MAVASCPERTRIAPPREAIHVIPILMYHSIAEQSEPYLRRWTVTPDAFLEHVTAMVESRRTPLTITQLAEGLRGARPLPARPMAITFDDGYRDTIAAASMLAGCEIASTTYITTGFLDRAGMLTTADVGELSSCGPLIEVGAHGISHRRMDELADDELRAEASGSRSVLEEIAQARTLSFAYPHGSHDRRSVAAVRDAGYTSAVAVKNALSHSGDDVFALARVTIEAHTSTATVRAALDGTLRMAPRGELWRTRGYRQLRRWRRAARSRSS